MEGRRPDPPGPLGRPLTGPAGYVLGELSPDGHTLAAGVTDATVSLWRVTDPARPSFVASLTGPAHAVYSVASPRRTTLAAGSANGTCPAVEHHRRATASGVCATAGHPLSRPSGRSSSPGRRYAPPCR